MTAGSTCWTLIENTLGTDVSVVFVVGWARTADSYTDTILGYANSIRTSDGGTHLDGMKAAITRTLNSLGRKSKILKV